MHAISAASRPLEPEEGSVVKLRVRFRSDGPPYTYLLYHAPSGEWYATGHSERWSWPELWRRFEGCLLDGPAQVLAPTRDLAW